MMILISSARSASMLSAVKPKQTSDSGRTYAASCELRPYVISCSLQAHPPKPPADSTWFYYMCENGYGVIDNKHYCLALAVHFV